MNSPYYTVNFPFDICLRRTFCCQFKYAFASNAPVQVTNVTVSTISIISMLGIRECTLSAFLYHLFKLYIFSLFHIHTLLPPLNHAYTRTRTLTITLSVSRTHIFFTVEPFILSSTTFIFLYTCIAIKFNFLFFITLFLSFAFLHLILLVVYCCCCFCC